MISPAIYRTITFELGTVILIHALSVCIHLRVCPGLQAVNVAQQQAGYEKDLSFSSGLILALEATDAAIGSLVNALKAYKPDSTTAIIITAKHGQSPLDSSIVRSFTTLVFAESGESWCHHSSLV